MINMMNSHRIILIFLLILFQLPIACKQDKTGTGEAKVTKENSTFVNMQTKQGRVISIYYFHTTFRCKSCSKIEAMTKQSLHEYFQKQLKSGKIVFTIINIDKEKNKHFVNEYQLFTKSVVLVDYVNGKQVNWKRLDQTWNHLRDPDGFSKYIKDEVIAFIKK